MGGKTPADQQKNRDGAKPGSCGQFWFIYVEHSTMPTTVQLTRLRVILPSIGFKNLKRPCGHNALVETPVHG
jgi:hypothetical protein